MSNATWWPEGANASLPGHLDACMPRWSPASRLALYSLLLACIGSTVLGNLLVVLAIAYFRRLRSATNTFIMSLAVADLLVGLVVMPCSAVRTVDGCWYFGPALCRLHSSLDVMLCSASIFHLSCIAFDRYHAVCHPLLYASRMSRGRVAVLLGLCWAVPLLISFGPITLRLHEVAVEPALPHDSCLFLVNPTYAVVASLVAFYLPMTSMLVAYWKIYRVARRQAMQISALENQVTAQDMGAGKHQRASLWRERKAAKTLGIIMGAFLLFWLPFFTTNIVDPFIEYRTAGLVWDIFLWLGYANSSLNPFLYGFFNRSFRRAFVMILSCQICLPGSPPSMDLSHSNRDDHMGNQ
ncbi:5-hydroxytryptamine receptor 4 [Paramormyrops kingsleyae]|uniref:5-hydroxytryptamine receptor 4 n=1 Tax=Paramormyrops kingsleyae TaxID=1676925 RepID=UPI003B97888B